MLGCSRTPWQSWVQRTPERVVRHYEAGVRIGELSLGDEFDGVLSWGLIDNRPFLRCLHGYGLCLWRLGRFGKRRPCSSGCCG